MDNNPYHGILLRLRNFHHDVLIHLLDLSIWKARILDEKCVLNLRDNLIKVGKGGLQHSTKDKNFSSLYVYYFTRFEFLMI